MLDAQKVCAAFLPEAVPNDFAQLAIPLTLIATDLYARSEVAFTSGDLKTAVAASMALPGLLQPLAVFACAWMRKHAGNFIRPLFSLLRRTLSFSGSRA